MDSVTKDWKTSCIGVVFAIFGFIALNPKYFQNFPILVDISRYVGGGGLGAAGLGFYAKDDYLGNVANKIKSLKSNEE